MIKLLFINKAHQVLFYKRKIFILILILLSDISLFAQDTSRNQILLLKRLNNTATNFLPIARFNDSLNNVPLLGGCCEPFISQTDKNGYHIYPYNKKRIRLVAAGNITGYSAALVGLNAAWYSNYPRSRFHFFNDNAEWLQVDKVGHIYGAYIESRFSNEMWRWSGISRNKRIWISGLSGVAYQTIIETLDGFSSEYGWSWGDFTSNIIGSTLFTAQEFAWDDQRIKLKFSFHKINYGQADLNARANQIFGKTEAERFIKDYNAVTDWVSVDLSSFIPKSNLPKWIAVAFGYGAQGMFGARSNLAVNKNGVVTFDRRDIQRYRQWYISPDIDLSKIKTNKKSLHVLLTVLSAFKFPLPSIEFSRGNVIGHWVQF